jgi:CubicO group peptidase (beta-lactamase class C family)
MSLVSYIISLLLLVRSSVSRCYDPSPAFPAPKHRLYVGSTELKATFDIIQERLQNLVAQPEFDISSFSVEITTSEESLWETHHTARENDPSRPGVARVDGNSAYRMASVTKLFTTLAIIQQHNVSNLNLDESIDRYLTNLSGNIAWQDITLRTVASQLSGIPRECEDKTASTPITAF